MLDAKCSWVHNFFNCHIRQNIHFKSTFSVNSGKNFFQKICMHYTGIFSCALFAQFCISTYTKPNTKMQYKYVLVKKGSTNVNAVNRDCRYIHHHLWHKAKALQTSLCSCKVYYYQYWDLMTYYRNILRVIVNDLAWSFCQKSLSFIASWTVSTCKTNFTIRKID